MLAGSALRRLGSATALLLAAACGGEKATDPGAGTSGKSAEVKAAKPAKPTRKAIRSIAVGGVTSCALMVDGTVRCWGGNTAGQLGIGKTPEQLIASATPVQVEGVKDARQLWVAASQAYKGDYSDRGTDTVCVQLASGAMKCWGYNQRVYGDGDTEARATPTAIGLNQVVDWDGRSGVACAVSREMVPRCWGHNGFGRLGTGDAAVTIERPKALPSMTNVAEVRCGANHCCFRKHDGTVHCAGYNSSGQLGNGEAGFGKESRVPVQAKGVANATQVVALERSTCVLAEASVKCWGYGFASTAVPVPGATMDVAQIDGTGLACALDKDRTVVCWGTNQYGELGDGSTTASTARAVPVAGLSNVTQIAVGIHHACAVVGSFEVKCWGKNSRGQLGDGTLEDRHAPVPVAGIADRALKPAAQPSAATGAAVTFPTAPAPCPKAPALTVTRGNDETNVVIRSAFALRNWSKRGLVIELANYTYDPAKRARLPRSDQLKLRFGLEVWKPKTKPPKKGAKVELVERPVDAEGPFVPNYLGQRHLGNQAGLLDGSTTHRFRAGSVTVSHLSDEWICGSIDLKGSTVAVKGVLVVAAPK